MAYFPVSNKVLATEPFSGALGHYTGEDDREGLSIQLGASQSLSRAAVLSAQVCTRLPKSRHERSLSITTYRSHLSRVSVAPVIKGPNTGYFQSTPCWKWSKV